jgi:uncharacterized protein YecE (DUF72 family)
LVHAGRPVLSRLIFGTSGWSYKEWVGPFYQNAKKMFSYYARFFNTAEINSTFYRYPGKSTIYGLNRASPPDFVFSAKLPRLLTHEKRLNPDDNVKKDLNRFLELLEPLDARGKLGCILIQLPPSFAYERDLESFKAFLEMAPEGYEFAAEFRHPSWMREDTWKLLERHNVAYCIVDEPLLPPEVHITADFAYFRWHGRNPRPWYDYHYTEEELAEWVPRVERTQDEVEKVYGYFNNHYHGYAVENCIEILEMLKVAKPEHERVKKRVIRHNLEKRPMMYERKLEDFGVTLPEESVEDLLLKLTDKGRLERGRKVKDEEIVIKESSDQLIEAKVKDYRIRINLEDRVLEHDCDDWRRGIDVRRICKHIAKVLLSLQPEKTKGIVRDILRNKESWVFQAYDSK